MGSRALVSTDARQSIHHQVLAAYPYEACGVLIGRARWALWSASDVYHCPNDLPQQQQLHSFVINPYAMHAASLFARDQGLEIIGFYHSHPNASPSPSEVDLRYCVPWPGYRYLIVGVTASAETTPRLWQLRCGKWYSEEFYDY